MLRILFSAMILAGALAGTAMAQATEAGCRKGVQNELVEGRAVFP